MGGHNHDTIICHNPGDVLWWASASPIGQRLIYYWSCPNAHIIIITLNVYCNQVLLLLIIVNLVNTFITSMSVLKKCISFLKEFSSSLQWMVTKLRKIKIRGREFGNPHYWIFYWPPLTKAQKICQISRIFYSSTITIFAHIFIHHSLTLPSCMHTTGQSDLVNVNNFTQR